MRSETEKSSSRAMAVLHPAFALTGVMHAIGGPLMPSLATAFHLNDNQAGVLFLLYFGGTSLGALLCRGNYARNMAFGFLGAALCCLAVAAASRPILPALFLLLGVGVGVPMSAVSLYTGRNFAARCAPVLTVLNFSWSVGAFAAPLLAAQVLLHYGFRTAYVILAVIAATAALACGLLLKDSPEQARPVIEVRKGANIRLIVVFAVAAFLQVGVENTSAAWLSTYSLRMVGGGVAIAAAASSFYWAGFLSSRGIASLVLLRVRPMSVFRVAVVVALVAGIFLAKVSSVAGRDMAMLALGAALAPVYPLVIAASLVSTRQTSDSRWVLATAGFGGSVLPWSAGWISNHAGSMRAGILVIPAALLLMALLVVAMGSGRNAITAE
ncbi:MAG TPA: MFS transporter [Terracidiphilus sp.]|nr:MFS transporter [Terracidiphilus sp.]